MPLPSGPLGFGETCLRSSSFFLADFHMILSSFYLLCYLALFSIIILIYCDYLFIPFYYSSFHHYSMTCFLMFTSYWFYCLFICCLLLPWVLYLLLSFCVNFIGHQVLILTIYLNFSFLFEYHSLALFKYTSWLQTVLLLEYNQQWWLVQMNFFSLLRVVEHHSHAYFLFSTLSQVARRFLRTRHLLLLALRGLQQALTATATSWWTLTPTQQTWHCPACRARRRLIRGGTASLRRSWNPSRWSRKPARCLSPMSRR